MCIPTYIQIGAGGGSFMMAKPLLVRPRNVWQAPAAPDKQKMDMDVRKPEALHADDDSIDRGSAAERSYRQIQDMVISFAIRPGDRINESALSRKLGVSRTPFREALNRLASDGFLDFVPAKGAFSARKSSPRKCST